MANNKLQLLIEADNRGLLPPDKKAILEELKSRGYSGDSTGDVDESSLNKEKDYGYLDEILARIFSSGHKGASEYDDSLQDVNKTLTKTSDYLSFPTERFGRGFTQGATEQVKNITNFFTDKLFGGSKSFSEVDKERLIENERKEENFPGGNVVGPLLELGGGFTKGSGPRNIWEGVSKIPFISKMLGSRGILNTLGKTAPAAAGRGLSTYSALSATDPDVDFTLPGAVLSSALDPLLMITGRSAETVGKGITSLARFLKNWFKNTNMGKGIEITKKENLVDDLTGFLKDEGVNTTTGQGLKVQSESGRIFRDESKVFNEFKDDLMKKIGKENVSVQEIQDTTNKWLSKLNLINEKTGAIDDAALDSVFGGDNSKMAKKLIETSQRLIKSPTIENLDIMKQSFGQLSQFSKKGSVPSSVAAFRDIRKSAANTIIEGSKPFIGEKGAQEFSAKNKQISQILDLKDDVFEKLLKAKPEVVIDALTNNVKPSDIEQAINLNPKFAQVFKDGFLGVMQKNIQKGDARIVDKQLRSLIFNIGRENLPKIFGHEKAMLFEKAAGIKDPNKFLRAIATILKTPFKSAAGQTKSGGFLPRLLARQSSESSLEAE